MSLVKWDPFRELESVSDHLNRIFGRSLTKSDMGKEMLTLNDWTPSVDISENASAYLIKGEIPGVKKEDVKVNIQNGMLTIQGERKMEKEEEGKKYHRIERCYGSFLRSFQIPDDADENAIKAEFKDGMINVTLPKSEKAKPKAINVEVS